MARRFYAFILIALSINSVWGKSTFSSDSLLDQLQAINSENKLLKLTEWNKSFGQKSIEELLKKLVSVQTTAADSAEAFMLAGEFYSEEKKQGKALGLFEKSLEILRKQNSDTKMFQSLFAIASTLSKGNNYKEAEKFAQTSFSISEKSGNLKNQLSSATLLQEITEKNGSIKQALYWQKKITTISGQINSFHQQISDSLMQKEGDSLIYKTKMFNAEASDVFHDSSIHTIQDSKWKWLSGVLALLLVATFLFMLSQQKSNTQTLNSSVLEPSISDVEIASMSASESIAENKQKTQFDEEDYAPLFQASLLSDFGPYRHLIPENFILFLPKEKLSGDFYFVTENKNKLTVATADCAGHGLKGAFLCAAWLTMLKECIQLQKISKPHEILNCLSEKHHALMEQIAHYDRIDNTMDIALISLNLHKMKLRFSGACNHLAVVSSEGKLQEYSGDNVPLSYAVSQNHLYTDTTIAVNEGDSIYLFTDGFYDQIGGDKLSKFKRVNFYNLLAEASQLPFDEQSSFLQSVFENWRGNNDQMDDVLVIGIKI